MLNIFLTQNGGILGPIAKLLGNILNGIFNILSYFGIENAGLCIIIFTFIVNALMIPLTIKQQKFSKLSSKMNPELTKITAKYKGKKDEVSMRKQQAETQEVYQKYGANPASGCLPLLITMPIMFALYRVIYNVPAYVGSIKEIYEGMAIAIQGAEGVDYVKIMTDFGETFSNLNMDKWAESGSLTINHIIDILANFKTSDWAKLATSFPELAGVIGTKSQEIMKVNSFIGGLNIADQPSFSNLFSLLIPILAVVSQYAQTKMMTSNTISDDNPTAASMKMMNNIMPLVTGVFCMMFPIGIGLYWISGSVFRIIQQFFVNKYMDKIDLNELIEKNAEKAKKKKARMGIDSSSKVEELAKTRTSTITDIATSKAKNNNNVNSEKGNNSYNPGSIASIANMLADKNKVEKGDK